MSDTAKTQPVYIDGEWTHDYVASTFCAQDPSCGEATEGSFPVSTWEAIDRALDAAQRAFRISRNLEGDQIAAFLEDYAKRIEADRDVLVELAHRETALKKGEPAAGAVYPSPLGLRMSSCLVRSISCGSRHSQRAKILGECRSSIAKRTFVLAIRRLVQLQSLVPTIFLLRSMVFPEGTLPPRLLLGIR